MHTMSPRNWETPEFTSYNRLQAHTPLFSWRDECDARYDRVSSSIMSLDGDWQFALYPSPEHVAADWAKENLMVRRLPFQVTGNFKGLIILSIRM